MRRHYYKEINDGSNIWVKEIVVSQHMANYEHEKGEVTIKAIAYEQNYYMRGIRDKKTVEDTTSRRYIR